MNIVEFRGKKAEMGTCLAEVVVEYKDGNKLFVTVHFYDGEYYTVSRQSVYDYLAGNTEEPAKDILEEYDDYEDAKKSEFAKVFKILRDMIGKLD